MALKAATSTMSVTLAGPSNRKCTIPVTLWVAGGRRIQAACAEILIMQADCELVDFRSGRFAPDIGHQP